MKAKPLRLGIVTFLFLLPAYLLAQPPQRYRTAAMPPGTQIKVRTIDKLDTADARAGQAFTATVAQPVVVGGRTLLARGQTVTGRVTNAVSSGRLKRPASITLELTRPGTQPLRLDGKSHLVRNAELIGGGTAAGALLGALAGGKKGAAVGALIGGGAGTAGAYMTGRKEIVIPPETELVFVTGSAAYSSTASAAGPAYRGETAPRESAAKTARESGSGRYASEEEDRQDRGGDRDAREGEDREGRGRDRERGRESAVPAFSYRDQRIIREYYAQSYSNLPPGLAKRGGNLPPGLERQLEKNGTLPPGLQKRVQPFPPELEQRLSPLPSGYSRFFLGARALIVNRNNRILDLIAVAR